MIKAQELRIGNYLQFYKPLLQEKQNLQVTEIFKEDDIYFVSSNEYAPINEKGLIPILLTHEILEGCGFEFKRSFIYPDKSEGERWIKGYYLVGKFYTGEGYSIEWIIAGSHSTAGVQLQYLHQLQNLYFALTGEELTVNLNLNVATTI